MVSSYDRDPGQHLYHLLKYIKYRKMNISELDRLIKYPRHLFLTSPIRLLLESTRSSEKQLEDLLKLNIPIYHAPELGKIWIHLNSSKSFGFILDERRKDHISCF
jgi:hypothetical protein